MKKGESGWPFGANGPMVHGFGAPEIVRAKSFEAKLLAQFLDPVFNVGPTVIATPHRQRVHVGWQMGDQRLKTITGHLQQALATSLRPLLNPAMGR